MKICQFTTVHPRNDVRVFYKTCVAFEKKGHDVTLVVADGKGDEIKQGVRIVDIGSYRSKRLSRYFIARKIMFKKIVEIDADFYEFHDPELLTLGKKLKRIGKTVVFDSHEDVPKQILYKSWLGPLFVRSLISRIYNLYEKKMVNQLDGLISVIEEITAKFQCSEKLTVKNYPITSLYSRFICSLEDKKKQIVYVGSLTKERGIYDCIVALRYLPEDFRLVLIGSFQSDKFREECEMTKEWSQVDYLGFKPMNEVAPIVGSSIVGLSVLHPEKNYLTSLPTKGFEYLAAGTPVVMSDFDYWEPYFTGCGKLIKPGVPKLIAEAILSLVEDKELYRATQAEGIERASLYSWEKEADKLIEFADKLVSKNK